MIAAKREMLAAKDRVKLVFIIILPSLIDCEIAQRACVAKVRRDAYRYRTLALALFGQPSSSSNQRIRASGCANIRKQRDADRRGDRFLIDPA
jgi:hypothetical protein